LQELQSILMQQKKSYNLQFVGKEVEVFLKGKGKKINQYRGVTKWMQTTNFQCDESQIKNKLNIKVTKAFDNSLVGDLV